MQFQIQSINIGGLDLAVETIKEIKKLFLETKKQCQRLIFRDIQKYLQKIKKQEKFITFSNKTYDILY